jgi:hypothetical protein
MANESRCRLTKEQYDEMDHKIGILLKFGLSSSAIKERLGISESFYRHAVKRIGAGRAVPFGAYGLPD